MIAVNNRLNREKLKKRIIVQSHIQILPVQNLQTNTNSAEMTSPVVKSIKSHIESTDIVKATTTFNSTSGNNDNNDRQRYQLKPLSTPDMNPKMIQNQKVELLTKDSQVNINEVEDENDIAYKCLEAFLKEIDEFQRMVRVHAFENDKILAKQYGDSFASFLEEKYIRQSLDKLTCTANLHHNSTVYKVKYLITRFIGR